MSGRYEEVVVGDITVLDVDVIVNAANPSLLGGGGIDGAIHRAAGEQLREHCRSLGGCDVGKAVLTPGFALPAQWIIHTVGPKWRDGEHGEPEQLASCYIECMKLADSVSARSIAFPAISSGIFGYPAELAAATATSAVRTVGVSSVDIVKYVCFDAAMAATVERALELL